jgi:hypothetical protein
VPRRDEARAIVAARSAVWQDLWKVGECGAHRQPCDAIRGGHTHGALWPEEVGGIAVPPGACAAGAEENPERISRRTEASEAALQVFPAVPEGGLIPPRIPGARFRANRTKAILRAPYRT